MELRTLLILMAVAIVMDFVGRMTRRRMAEQDPALEREEDDSFLAALMEAGGAERTGVAEEPAGEGERRMARAEAGEGSAVDGRRAAGAVQGGTERPVRDRTARQSRAAPVRQVVAERTAPSVPEVLAGVAAPTVAEMVRGDDAVAGLSDPATVRARSRVVRPRLGGRRGLRDAVVAREILGPPVALRPNPDPENRNEVR